MPILMTDLLRRLAAVLLSLATAMCLTGTAMAQGHDMTPQPPASPLAAKCAALVAADFAAVPDAPTRVNTAKLVAAANGAPAYCEVEGFVAPQVGILMRLPAENWNGKFLQVGCGGFCGTTMFIMMCGEPLKRGYACITTDMGHRAKEVEGVEWAYNNPQAVIDFAYRATHVTALAGKAIVATYYGRKPERSYFSGCSCGGRQALVEAQRFPWDFDGIIVGAPGFDYTDLALSFARRARALRDARGNSLFDAKSRQVINAAIVAQCDRNDGVKDGLIGDPRQCQFRPQALVCRPGATTNCLTPEQATAAADFYAEHRSASGDRLGERAFMPGSEVSMMGLVETPLMTRAFYEDFFKYMALDPAPGPSWRFENFNLNEDYKRLGAIQGLLRADNPDLTRFRQRGGKLIFYHGWADAGPSPLASIDYYNKVERTMGGRPATQDFFRLFMVPDMDHCAGGAGPWAINYLDYLEQWVEQGKAPDALVGSNVSSDPMFADPTGATKPKIVRPIYPYPLRAQYKGGDPNKVASFRPVTGE